MLILNIQRVSKHLPEDIQQKTGFPKGVYHMSDKTRYGQGEKCFDWKENNCNGQVQIFEMRIMAVLNEQNDKISLDNLDAAVVELLKTTNQKICLCMEHLSKAISEGTLHAKATPIVIE